ncbi:MAG: DUF3341 domain-containing protein [Bacteriovoracaceae bacterium]|nr:DUF3341 domain-containing protein [Bacteriovoracaceae bacterium]
MSNKYLLGVFHDEHDMIHAAKALKKSKIVIHDIYTPFPVHGLDQYLDIKPTRLPVVTLVAGTTGLVLALLFQYWVSVIDWPINVGGKPFNSFAAFIPVAFEITVLFGAFITVFAFLMRSKLAPVFSSGIMHSGATQDKFVIALAVKDASFDTQNTSKTLADLGASEVSIREVK